MKVFYGAIMGDVVGSIYEFHNIKSKAFPLFSKRCFFTDDTVMTLAITDVLIDEVSAGRFDTNTDEDWRQVFTEYMRRLGRHYPHSGYGGRFKRWLWSEDPQPYNSCGNGSAMRVSPVAYFARSLEECEHLARLTAEPTHNHPDGIAGAQATAGAVYLALHGGTKDEIKAYVDRFYGDEVERYTKEQGLSAFTLKEIRPIYSFDHYAGLCAGTVPFAVEAFLESDPGEHAEDPVSAGLADTIRNTVSIGGDTDSLGAISGAIAEAYYGLDHKYREVVEHYLTIEFMEILWKLDELDWPKSAG